MDNPIERLTPRERDVLNAICKTSCRYEDAARDMGLAVNTIKQHLANARKKTGLSNEQLCYELGRERP